MTSPSRKWGFCSGTAKCRGQYSDYCKRCLNVEIFPLISTSIKWQGYGEDRLGERDAWAGNQGMLFDESPGLRTAVLELLHKIEESSMSLDAIRRQVEKTFGEKVPRGRKRWK